MSVSFGGADALYLTASSFTPSMGAFWFYPTTFGTTQTMYARRNAFNGSYMQVEYRSGRNLRIQQYNAITISARSATSTGAATVDAWNHCFWYADGGSRLIYLNGGNKGSNFDAGGLPALTFRSVGARITAATPTFVDHFSGRIAEFWESLVSGSPSSVDLDNYAYSLYTARQKVNEGQYNDTSGSWNYWDFVRSLTSRAEVARTFNIFGSSSYTDHPPLVTESRRKMLPINRVVSLGGHYNKDGRIILV